ncbi:MAG: hypothetical protein ACRDL7_00335 [Gaiellaceae bacterium]
MESTRSYQLAQRALADLKIAVHEILALGPEEGLTNAQVGRVLGIYGGHEGHEGHISRVILGLLENDGTAKQSESTKRWTIRQHVDQQDS